MLEVIPRHLPIDPALVSDLLDEYELVPVLAHQSPNSGQVFELSDPLYLAISFNSVAILDLCISDRSASFSSSAIASNEHSAIPFPSALFRVFSICDFHIYVEVRAIIFYPLSTRKENKWHSNKIAFSEVDLQRLERCISGKSLFK